MEMGGWAAHRGRVGFVQDISVVDIRSPECFTCYMWFRLWDRFN